MDKITLAGLCGLIIGFIFGFFSAYPISRLIKIAYGIDTTQEDAENEETMERIRTEAAKQMKQENCKDTPSESSVLHAVIHITCNRDTQCTD